jgi:hypothetical protein
MAKKTKNESFADFMSHKVKNYAEYCDFMRFRNSGRDINSLKYTEAHFKL